LTTQLFSVNSIYTLKKGGVYELSKKSLYINCSTIIFGIFSISSSGYAENLDVHKLGDYPQSFDPIISNILCSEHVFTAKKFIP
jgi:hypothetical protein